MRQYDVHRTKQDTLVVILQSDFRPARSSRIVAPIVRGNALPVEDVDIPVTVEGAAALVRMNQLGAVRIATLDPHPVGDLSEHRDAFTRAVDLLFTGF